MATLGELFNFKYGKGLPQEKRNNHGLIDVYGSNGRVGVHDDAITKGPTIIVGRKGSVGEIHLSSEKCWPIDTTYFIDEFPAGIPANYWAFYLKSLQLGQQDKSSAIPGISRNDIYGIDVPVPPLPEQRRIVAKLEKLLGAVDSSKNRLAKIPALLKRFRQSVLASACSGRLTEDWREENPDFKSELCENASTIQTSPLLDGELPSIPESWAFTDIKPLLSTKRPGMKTGPFGTMLKKHEHQESGIPVLGIENIGFLEFKHNSKIHITCEKAAELAAYQVMPNDILISRSGTVGEVCVVPHNLGEARMSTNVIRIVLNAKTILPYLFCYTVVGSPFVLAQIRELCKGSTRDFLNQTILKTLIFPLPPLPEQHEIVRRVEALFALADRIEARYATAQAHVDRLTQTILAKAFRGELVPQDPNDESAAALLERIRKEREQGEKEPKRQKRTSVMSSKESSRLKRSLVEILEQAPKALTPEELFTQAGYDDDSVEQFFVTLRDAVDKGKIKQNRPNKNDVFLEASQK